MNFKLELLAILSRKISYKTSLLIFVALALLATTTVTHTLQSKEAKIAQESKDIGDLRSEINNLDKDTSPLEESDTSKNSDVTSQEGVLDDDTISPPPPPGTVTPPPGITPPPNPPAPSPCGNTIIVINSSGNYSQLNVTINQGKTICWVNNDSKVHQPASDPHPFHTGYSGFDSEPGISPGASWSFKFDKKGSWDWHDHKIPSITGTITVL